MIWGRILIVFLLAIAVSAQENQPRLIDEFGVVPNDETMARIDALAVAMSNTPDAGALIRVYGGTEKAFAAAYGRGSLLKSMWMTRKFPVEKLSIQFCNVNGEPLRTRFFVVEKDDKLESCAENLVVPKETVLFNRVMFHSPVFKLAPQEDVPVDVVGAWGGEYSRFAFDVLKKLLDDSPGSRVYAVAYTKTNFKTDDDKNVIAKSARRLDKKAYALRMLGAARRELVKNGFSNSRIVTVDGGYLNDLERRLEFWFVPAGGAIPKPKPDYVPRRKSK